MRGDAGAPNSRYSPSRPLKLQSILHLALFQLSYTYQSRMEHDSSWVLAGREILPSTPSPEPPLLSHWAHLIHARMFPNTPTPGKSVYAGIPKDDSNWIEATLVDDVTDSSTGSIMFGGSHGDRDWDKYERVLVRRRRAGRPAAEVRAMVRAAREVDALRKGLLTEEEAEGLSLIHPPDAQDDAEGR